MEFARIVKEKSWRTMFTFNQSNNGYKENRANLLNLESKDCEIFQNYTHIMYDEI